MNGIINLETFSMEKVEEEKRASTNKYIVFSNHFSEKIYNKHHKFRLFFSLTPVFFQLQYLYSSKYTQTHKHIDDERKTIRISIFKIILPDI